MGAGGPRQQGKIMENIDRVKVTLRMVWMGETTLRREEGGAVGLEFPKASPWRDSPVRQ